MQLDTDEFEHPNTGEDMFTIEHSDKFDWFVAIDVDHVVEVLP